MFKKNRSHSDVTRQTDKILRISTSGTQNKFSLDLPGRNSRKILAKGGLGAALLLSGFAHIFFTSAVTIVTPRDFFRTEPFTRVTFLGPILEKTAFDIMVSSDEAGFRPNEIVPPADLSKIFLSRKARHGAPAQIKLTPDNGTEIYAVARDSLPSGKIQPDLFFKDGQGLSPGRETVYTSMSGSGRKVIYRPDIPGVSFDAGPGSGNDRLKVTVGAFIDVHGNVIKPRVIRTSGSPYADVLACDILSKWRFQASGREDGAEEFFDTEIIIDPVTGGFGNDKT